MSVNNKPCTSCPYRKDVPSGIWDEGEYDKLAGYDEEEMWMQPSATFGCHQADGSVCRGWLHCHGTDLLTVRLHWKEEYGEILDAGPGVELFGSAGEAIEHGMADIDNPGPEAEKMMAAIQRKKA